MNPGELKKITLTFTKAAEFQQEKLLPQIYLESGAKGSLILVQIGKSVYQIAGAEIVDQIEGVMREEPAKDPVV